MKYAPDPNCEFCEGSGVDITPAYQRGGDVVDEQERDCICTLSPNIDDDMDDSSDFLSEEEEQQDNEQIRDIQEDRG